MIRLLTLTCADNVLRLVYCSSSSSCTTGRHTDLENGITLTFTDRISIGILIRSCCHCATSDVDVISSNGTGAVRKRGPWYDYFIANLLWSKVNWTRRIWKQSIKESKLVCCNEHAKVTSNLQRTKIALIQICLRNLTKYYKPLQADTLQNFFQDNNDKIMPLITNSGVFWNTPHSCLILNNER